MESVGAILTNVNSYGINYNKVDNEKKYCSR